MIGADTTFLVQLELVEMPAHQSAHQLLQRESLKSGMSFPPTTPRVSYLRLCVKSSRPAVALTLE